jgi:hypothetical protein
MIRFYCEHCAHKISARDKDIGRQGKCSKCGSIIVVPTESTVVEFNCEYCDRKISTPKSYAGKKVVCPKCNNSFFVPSIHAPGSDANQDYSGDLIPRTTDSTHGLTLMDVPNEYKLKDEPAIQPKVPEQAIDQHQGSKEIESSEQRKLPWIIDIFLYPTSNGGLLTLATIILLRLFTDIATVMLMCCVFGGILSLIIRIVLVWSYMYWYFSECVRDSADGGLRAPNIIGTMPGLVDMFWYWARLFACLTIFLGPAIFYRGYTYFTNIEVNNAILLSLLAFGAFFFPMNVLAVVMFDSVNGMNPILVIRSIISTFLQYCGLFILFYGLSILLSTMLGMVLRISSRTRILSGGFFTYILFNLLMAYALLIAGHLLGRFYWLYQKKLNWEV